MLAAAAYAIQTRRDSLKAEKVMKALKSKRNSLRNQENPEVSRFRRDSQDNKGLVGVETKRKDNGERRRSCEVRKEVVDFHVNEATMLETGKPIDYSFKKFTKLIATGMEGARLSRIGRLPSKNDSQKYLTRAIWVNNNKLIDINNMDAFVESILVEPNQLSWIDFSYNYIVTIDEIILKYQDLKIIYFHGNLIEDLDEIVKLKELKNLRSVTFHGNPLSQQPRYRSFVITMLPQIVNLDFTPIIKSERFMPQPPEALRRLSDAFDDTDEPSPQKDAPPPELVGEVVGGQKADKREELTERFRQDAILGDDVVEALEGPANET